MRRATKDAGGRRRCREASGEAEERQRRRGSAHIQQLGLTRAAFGLQSLCYALQRGGVLLDGFLQQLRHLQKPAAIAAGGLSRQVVMACCPSPRVNDMARCIRRHAIGQSERQSTVRAPHHVGDSAGGLVGCN